MLSPKLARVLAVLTVVVVLVVALGGGLLVGYQYILNQNDRFAAYDAAIEAKANPTPTPDPATADPDDLNRDDPDPQDILVTADTPGAVMVYIELGDTPSDIADRLEDLGVIDNTLLYTLLSKFNGFDDLYRSGTHFVTKDMSYDEIMYTLTLNPATVSVRFPEDLTYEEFKQVLFDHDIIFDEAEMDAIVSHPTMFSDYDFIQAIPNMDSAILESDETLVEREWVLQGYLFPDTYLFDLNTSVEEILRTILDNADRKLKDEYFERAAELGMTMDQIITLASVIQMESGHYDDMALVSRVFHNRMKQEDLLQSCATVNYLRIKQGKEPIFIVQAEDLQMLSYYNTYISPGLPPGPICSPSELAIRAALYPDVDHQGVYYFAAKGDGTNAFASTFAEHEANINTYLVPLQEGIQDS